MVSEVATIDPYEVQQMQPQVLATDALSPEKSEAVKCWTIEKIIHHLLRHFAETFENISAMEKKDKLTQVKSYRSKNNDMGSSYNWEACLNSGLALALGAGMYLAFKKQADPNLSKEMKKLFQPQNASLLVDTLGKFFQINDSGFGRARAPRQGQIEILRQELEETIQNKASTGKTQDELNQTAKEANQVLRSAIQA